MISRNLKPEWNRRGSRGEGDREKLAYPSQRGGGGRGGGGGRLQEALLWGGARGGVFLQEGAGRRRCHVIDVLKVGGGGDEGVTGRGGGGGGGRRGGGERSDITNLYNQGRGRAGGGEEGETGQRGEKKGGVSVMNRAIRGEGVEQREENMPAGGGEKLKRGGYQREVHEDLHPVSWSHVGHVVKVCRIRNHPGPKLRVSQHLPVNTGHVTHPAQNRTHTAC